MAVPRLLGANVTVDNFGEVGRKGNEGRSGVDRSAGALQLEDLVSELDLLELDLPVSLAADGDVVDVSSVVRLVDTSECRDTLFGVRAEPEGKDGVVEETLVDHVVERRDDMLDRDRVVSETEDTV